jgi:hypothetical protein
MSNGARHGLGVVIGLVVTPIIALCLSYGATKYTEYFRYFVIRGGSERWAATALVVVAAVLVGLVAGSRTSPLASLIPGFVYTVVGILWVVAPRWSVGHSGRDLLPRDIHIGYTVLAPYGVFLLLGVALLAASLPPSRWRASTRAGAVPRFTGPPPAPMGPPPMPGGPAPMGAPQPPPAHGPSWQGAPQYGAPPAQPAAPPAQPAAPNPPPLPPASPAAPPPAQEKKAEPSIDSEDDDGPGEWTRMYGGDRPK